MTVSTPKPAATRTKPKAITFPVPSFSASMALRGAMAIRAKARGMVDRPALSGE